MTLFYHGTSIENKKKIEQEGFKTEGEKSHHALGEGVYLTDDYQIAQAYGEEVITVDIQEHRYLSFEERWGEESLGEFLNKGTWYDGTSKSLRNYVLTTDKIGIKLGNILVVYREKELVLLSTKEKNLHPNEWRKQHGIDSVYGIGLVDLYQQEKES